MCDVMKKWKDIWHFSTDKALETKPGVISGIFSSLWKSMNISPQLLAVVFSCEVVSHSFVTPWTVACQAPLSMGCPRRGN